MSDLVLDNIANPSRVSVMNDNFEKIEDKINDDVLQNKDGHNTMLQDLDMDSNQILNLPRAVNDTDPVRLIDLEEITGLGRFTIPVSSGGTGSSTASGARTNLGVDSSSEVDAKVAVVDAKTEKNKQDIALIKEIDGIGESFQTRQSVEALYKAQGYNNVFFFEGGFTYTESNDVGIYEDGTAWIYADAGALPVTIAAGTVPSEGVYKAVKVVIPSFNTVAEVKEFNGLSEGLEVGTKGFYTPGDGGSSKYLIVSASSVDVDEIFNYAITGTDLAAATVVEGAALNLAKLGMIEGADPSRNDDILAAATDYMSTRGGGRLYIPPHDNKFMEQYQQKEGVRLVGIDGFDRGFAGMRYVGTVFQDFITAASGNRNYMSLERLIIYGGEYQTGRARYVVNYDSFNTLCWIKDCFIRDGLGLLKIDSGYYCELDNVVCQRVTPRQDSPPTPFTDGEFGNVYSGINAPVYLGEMNGSTVNALQLSNIISENVTASQPVQALYISGEDIQGTGWRFENIGTPYDSFNPTVQVGIRGSAVLELTTLYVENAYVTNDMIRNEGFGRINAQTLTMYDIGAQTLVRNNGVGDVYFVNGQVWRADVERLDFTPTSGDGLGSKVNFGAVSFRSGTENNTQDTKDATFKNGCIDGPIRNSENDGEYKEFPKVITGLSVTSGADSGGSYVSITGGTFKNQSGREINSKVSVQLGVNLADQVLRPQLVSSDYKIFVGKAGNIFISVVDASTLADPRGNWLAYFSTDASGGVVGITNNPRLSEVGRYINGSTAEITKSSNVAPTLASLRDGDRVINTSGDTGFPQGWVRSSGAIKPMASYP